MFSSLSGNESLLDEAFSRQPVGLKIWADGQSALSETLVLKALADC
jgi:hypothetical protein